MKRAFDLLASAVGIVLAAPLLALISAAIKLDSPGPIFYRGRRVGRFGRPFRIYKFRTMVINAEAIGGSSTGDHDPRITRIGRLLRKAKLDELPQLINVLLGEMSLVGPRPEVQQYVDLYTDEEKALLELRPGITDWASIWNSDEGALLAGAEDPDKAYEQLIRPTKLRLQLGYARNRSLWIDLRILFLTVYRLVNRKYIPREIRAMLGEVDPNRRESADPSATVSFATVTEVPGMGATIEQLSMLHTRYRLAAELCRGKDVLEVACGPGVGLGHLSRAARRLIAGDVDPQFVGRTRQYYGERVDVRQLDAQALPFPDGSFDVILLLEAIYFLTAPERFVAEARRVLRPGGQVLIATANRERPDFNPSPHSHRYLAAHELQKLLTASGFEAQLFGAYPAAASSAADRLLRTLRRVAIRLRLIPGSMKWKTRLKRLVFGRLNPLPQELEVDEALCADLIPLSPAQSAPGYKVIYAIGRRAA